MRIFYWSLPFGDRGQAARSGTAQAGKKKSDPSERNRWNGRETKNGKQERPFAHKARILRFCFKFPIPGCKITLFFTGGQASFETSYQHFLLFSHGIGAGRLPLPVFPAESRVFVTFVSTKIGGGSAMQSQASLDWHGARLSLSLLARSRLSLSLLARR